MVYPQNPLNENSRFTASQRIKVRPENKASTTPTETIWNPSIKLLDYKKKKKNLEKIEQVGMKQI